MLITLEALATGGSHLQNAGVILPSTDFFL